ncbi:MAG TPA: efflux RND transporter periplasmic adaptor subunit [Opitutaceae bacterium]
MTACLCSPAVRLLALGVFSAACALAPVRAQSPKPILVRTQPVKYSTEPIPIHLSGVISRRTEADLSFKVGGVVETVSVRVGDRVTKGQVLARLRLDEIEAQVTAAQSALDKARRDLGRIERLQANAVATLENLQDARTAVEVAESQLRIAEFNRRYAVVTAPADGRILRRVAEPDELVSAGRAILGFAAEADGWLARAGLAAKDAARIRVGDMADVGFAEGRIVQISEGVDPATRTVPIEISVAEVPASVRSGAVVSISLHPQVVEPRPEVPAAALVEGAGGQASLFLVEDGEAVARRVAVEVEALQEAGAYLKTPLPSTARVVVQGSEYLHDGAAVELLDNVAGTRPTAVQGAATR